MTKMYFIYIIENWLNDCMYVGLTTNPAQRWKRHKSIARNKNSKNRSYLHSSISKYGEEYFSFETIESYCSDEEARQAEKFWISHLKCGGFNLYNLSDGGEVGTSNHVWSDKQRVEASKRMSGKNNYFYGKKLFGETNGNYGKKMKPHVKEILLKHRCKLTEGQVNEIRTLYATGTHTQTQLSKQFNISLTQIHCIVKYKRWNDGAEKPKTKPRLGWNKVKEIRELYVINKYSHAEIAEMFNISSDHLYTIISNTTWFDPNYRRPKFNK